MALNQIWDLESIFAGGSQSQSLAVFLDNLSNDLTAYENSGMPAPLNDKTETTWIDRIQTLYQLEDRLGETLSYIYCLFSQDVNDDKAMQLLAQCETLNTRVDTLWTQLAAAYAAQDDKAWHKLLTQTELSKVAFHLNEERDMVRQKMSPELEALANDLASDGYHAWSHLYSVISDDKEVIFDDNPMSLYQLQSKVMNDPQPEVRRRAFALFEKGWGELAKNCAQALNHQAGFRLTLYKHRGWNSVLQEPLRQNRMTGDTLDTMWHMVEAKSSKLLDYFKAKTKLLGQESLSWYDINAPCGEVSQTLSYQEAADFVINAIHNFNPDIGDFCHKAIQNRWIEAEDRPGKRAGGYCTTLPLKKESRIFMTFKGNYNSMLTLAHELGHAYHSWVMRDMPSGACNYTASIAETASTFNEMIVRDASQKTAVNEQDRLSILGIKLDNATRYMMAVRVGFEFEKAFLAQRAKKQLGVDELNELMVTAQKLAFKNGLSQYHPLFWASVRHFYLTHVPFYNFPYTFGYLFSHGVYAQALAEGPNFAERYNALLRDTGSKSTEDLAKTHLNVDLTQPEFWETAIDRILGDVDQFVTLVDKLH